MACLRRSGCNDLRLDPCIREGGVLQATFPRFRKSLTKEARFGLRLGRPLVGRQNAVRTKLNHIAPYKETYAAFVSSSLPPKCGILALHFHDFVVRDQTRNGWLRDLVWRGDAKAAFGKISLPPLCAHPFLLIEVENEAPGWEEHDGPDCVGWPAIAHNRLRTHERARQGHHPVRARPNRWPSAAPPPVNESGRRATV